MIPSDVLKKIKALEIKTRRIVTTTLSGEYHSVFKGRGISFSEVREYQPGDDIRLIDWNVTARTGMPHIKLFEEERELTVLIMLDCSGSGSFGTDLQTKIEYSAEIAAVLGFSAVRNNDRVGLILFTDTVELFIPPKKGKSHMFRILRDIYYFQTKGKGTSISTAVDYMMRMTNKKAIVFLISDFMDSNYEKSLRTAAKKHDLVPILVEDPAEQILPSSGLVVLKDAETGNEIVLDTSAKDLRAKYKNICLARQKQLDRFFKSINTCLIRAAVSGSYITPLMRFFKLRAKRY
ncbi:DUF58 domain-containing protein [Thermoproteota archaeon]